MVTSLRSNFLSPSQRKMKTNTHLVWVFFILSLLLAGCGTSPPAPSYDVPPVRVTTPPPPIARDIRGPASVGISECRRQTPDPSGRRAFFGVAADTCRDSNGRLGVYMVADYNIRGKKPATEEGMKLGDRIISINGCRVSTSGELTGYMQEFTPGNAAQFVVERNGIQRTVIVPTIAHTPTKTDAAIKPRPVPLCSNIGLRTP